MHPSKQLKSDGSKCKLTLVYVGHSHHRTTSSSAFFLKLLAQHYNVTVIWDEGWKLTGPPVRAEQINDLRPDIVVFYQTLPPIQQLRRVRCTTLFLVPMHDHVVGNPNINWKVIHGSGIRLINFCRATHDYFIKLGYESRCVQYWPAPFEAATHPVVSEESFFFWVRKRDISWPTLKVLLGATRPQRVLLRIAPDPGENIDIPTMSDIDEYRIQIVDGWLDKMRYLELLKSCQFFMAPRFYEGIGLSFLEAMSLGLAVIAPDNPTMNEYIRHNYNGYLYSPTKPTPLNFSAINSIRTQALQDVASGHKKWLTQQPEVIHYIGSHRKPGTGPSLGWRIRGLLSS